MFWVVSFFSKTIHTRKPKIKDSWSHNLIYLPEQFSCSKYNKEKFSEDHYIEVIRKMVSNVFLWILNTMNDWNWRWPRMDTLGAKPNIRLLLNKYFKKLFSQNIFSSVRSTPEYVIMHRPIYIDFENTDGIR